MHCDRERCCRARGSALPDPQAALSGARLALALKSGGFTLYFRHAATHHSQTDRNQSAFDECSLQRNLSEAGRRDARVVGETMRPMQLAVSEVRAICSGLVWLTIMRSVAPSGGVARIFAGRSWAASAWGIGVS